mmetsp:Transcript_2014/g.3143  ORF Transcript_2014/g.3143 Transcript_2014/m.3143 type:complete len:85 (+) Transcript_2014:146-400(+)
MLLYGAQRTCRSHNQLFLTSTTSWGSISEYESTIQPTTKETPILGQRIKGQTKWQSSIITNHDDWLTGLFDSKAGIQGKNLILV